MELPLTIEDAARRLRDGDLTSTELTGAVLERVEALDDGLGAFVLVTPGQALEAAAAADRDLAAGIDRGPLQGIPLGIKDIIATADAPTTANSLVLDPAWGAGRDAPVVARLRAAGAVLVGKTTTSEFACGAPDDEKPFPIPRNPWDVARTASGSSSGTGIAVAAGMVLGGLGTDTGGSVRGPAAVNGHTGLKVTFGRVPKAGVVPLGYSLDSVGPMARSSRSCALLLEVMAGAHADDPCAADVEVPAYAAALTGDLDGVVVGVPREYFFDTADLDAEVRAAVLDAVEALAGAGATVRDVTIPHAAAAKEACMAIALAEAFAYHRPDLASRWTDYGRFTRIMLGLGGMVSGGQLVQAQRFRSYFRAAVVDAMAGVDVLVTPTMTTPAERTDEMDPVAWIERPSFTGQWNLTGMPALAVPCGFSAGGLPLSMQLVAKPFDEAAALRVGDAYQQLTDWHLRVPPVAAAALA
jgi:aspartyl-tRNA(Asn)/glutamyl-tRNA(Gln) amidotransferase subunit A